MGTAPEPGYARIKEVFTLAADLPESQRAACLDGACGGDGALRAAVEALLRLDAHTGGPLDDPGALAGLVAAGASDQDPMLGTLVGEYLVVERLGEGGMGAVYLARRADGQFDQQVAIKVIRHGYDSEAMLRRFRAERQTLANLAHANIAALLGGGALPDGRPYIVIEHVTGVPIDDWCRGHAAPIRERTELLARVCDAVQFAHQRLVVHRDLKPGNVLVTAQGVPKLLDFGIAKVLDGLPDESASPATIPAARLLTPQYASPEQLRGEAVSTASDVYSLGVMLYELLTGGRPVRAATGADDRPTKRPSSVLAQAPRPGARPGEARRIAVEVRGDLDTIALKALHADPALRYQTAGQLADDLRRWRAGRPVSARADTVVYRARMFVKRNRALTGFAAAAFLTLAVLAPLASWQAAVASAERDRARQRFDDVRSLANAFVFEVHDAVAQLPGSTPARRLIVEQGLRYLDALAPESDVDEELTREIATAYVRLGDVLGNPNTLNLGDTRAALDAYARAAELVGRSRSPSPALTRALWVARMRELNIHLVRGELDAARTAAGRGLETIEALARTRGAVSGRDRAIAHERMGDVHRASGQPRDALASYTAALELAERFAGDDPAQRPFLAVYHEKIGDVLAGPGFVNLDDAPAALRSYLRALDLHTAAAPDSAQSRRGVVIVTGKIGAILLGLDDLAGALEQLERAAQEAEALAGADPANASSQFDLAVALTRLGEAQVRAGRFDEAIGLHDRSVALRRDLSRRDAHRTQWLDAVAVGQHALALAHLGAADDRPGDEGAHLSIARDALGEAARLTAELLTLDALSAANRGRPELLGELLGQVEARLALADGRGAASIDGGE